MSMELRRKEDLEFFKKLVSAGFEFFKVYLHVDEIIQIIVYIFMVKKIK